MYLKTCALTATALLLSIPAATQTPAPAPKPKSTTSAAAKPAGDQERESTSGHESRDVDDKEAWKRSHRYSCRRGRPVASLFVRPANAPR